MRRFTPKIEITNDLVTCLSLRDALECVVTLPRTREGRQNCVRFAYRGPLVDRLHVLELTSTTWNDVPFELKKGLWS